MANHLDEFEKWFLAQLRLVPQVTACVGSRIFNQKAPPRAQFPYLVFTVVPLENAVGQKNAPILSRFLCDSIIFSRAPLAASITAAVAGADAHFISPALDRQTAEIIVSIYPQRPINQARVGASEDETILLRGTTFKAFAASV